MAKLCITAVVEVLKKLTIDCKRMEHSITSKNIKQVAIVLKNDNVY